MKLFHVLRLVRPANIVTSVADVLAGIAIAGAFIGSDTPWPSVIALCVATACLYGGGIVFNDVFDLELDKVERPERALPSGLISLKQAITLGSVLLTAGVALSFTVNPTAGFIALGIAILALLYNKYSKHFTYLGPFNMGLCRGFNLLLGISISHSALETWYPLGIIPVLYIFSITLISQGEVHGGGKPKLITAAVLYTIVAGSITAISILNDQVLQTIPFVVLFLIMIFRPLVKAFQQPIGKNIGMAVKAGVISLILMDAAWAACFYSLYAALFIAALLPVSMWLGKRFAVT